MKVDPHQGTPSNLTSQTAQYTHLFFPSAAQDFSTNSINKYSSKGFGRSFPPDVGEEHRY